MTTFISAPRTSIRYYKDSGPSLFHEVKKTYSHSQIQANFSGFKSQTQKPKLHKNQRLKPCRKICRKSIENSTFILIKSEKIPENSKRLDKLYHQCADEHSN